MGSAAGAAVGLAPGTSKTHSGIRTGGAGLGPRCPPGKEAVLEPGGGGRQLWFGRMEQDRLHTQSPCRDRHTGRNVRSGAGARATRQNREREWPAGPPHGKGEEDSGLGAGTLTLHLQQTGHRGLSIRPL